VMLEILHKNLQEKKSRTINPLMQYDYDDSDYDNPPSPSPFGILLLISLTVNMFKRLDFFTLCYTVIQ
jgi:hypothetical protein